MDEIVNASGDTIAIIESDGVVYDPTRSHLGRVLGNGEVYDRDGHLAGRYEAGSKYVYKGNSRVGSIGSDGKVFDYGGKSVGKIIGSNIASGAVLLLLVE